MYSFENCGPLFQEMPAFLRKNSYQDVTDGKACVFQPAYRTELDTYTYFSQHPENLKALIKYMGLEQDVRGRWLKEYPFEKQTQDWNPKPEEAVFVDIGGNVGHYCALFKSEFPNILGRILLEDLPDTLAHALPTPGVEKLGHDFFEPQPIKGECELLYSILSSLCIFSGCRKSSRLGNILGQKSKIFQDLKGI